MKKYLKFPLIVEGKEDASYLSNYIASEIIVTNGYELDSSLISYLKDKEVIVMTDPDEAGKQIRNRLNGMLNKVHNVEVDISKCIRGKKNGIAECQIDEILCKLALFFENNPENHAEITSFDLYQLKISENSQLRAYVSEKLNLGTCNNKQLLKRMNNTHVKLEVLKDIVNQYNHGN